MSAPESLGEQVELALDHDGVIHRVMTCQFGRLICGEGHWPAGVWTFTGALDAVTCAACAAQTVSA